MRTGLLALRAAGAAALLVALPVTAAQAEGGGSVTVTPYGVPPGSEVDLRVSGCDGTTGKASSAAFVSTVSLGPSADQPTLFAEARVKSSTAPGTYDILVVCPGRDIVSEIKGSIRVMGSSHTVTPTPTAPVHAGGGGAAAELAAAHPAAAPSEGPGTRHAVIGLVLAAVAAVAVAFRSVRRRRSARQ
ncbi:hypothetical protein GTY65_18475 [Streptomyces sp. SID8379]|uniref:hypothetical protein n=1 Tax=unclassified Streptomyces TaxID=2593676 RepID=UPI0003AA074A|nr:MULTISPECIES: hypothetical protein [unclassified Streptomyces]MYW66022.1 hypothetical protein [Streptomyces sp. SID8379]